MNMSEDSYDKICSQINTDWEKIIRPDKEDLIKLSKKFNVEVSVVRECVGLTDYYNFELDD